MFPSKPNPQFPHFLYMFFQDSVDNPEATFVMVEDNHRSTKKIF